MLAALALPTPAPAQTVEPPHLIIPRVARPPSIADFASMSAPDAALQMHRVEGFVQRFPNDGESVSERTIVYVGYDNDALYVAFQCFDREPDRMGAHVLPRDAFPNDEDTVAVHIDTFRDLKHGYGFQTNAYGVQTDGIYTEGSGWDLSWDAVWRSEGRLTATGYAVLYAIPFKSLRFPSTDSQQWGMFFYRAIARKNEQVYWPPCSTRLAARFPQAAIVMGIDRVSPARNLQAIPYAASRTYKAIDAAGAAPRFVTNRVDAAGGVDLKAVLRDSIVVDVTANPDFSQVESDQPQITVNKPFEVFFPEKRPFFLENATYFNTPVPLLFTRRIGDPRAGGRATGRAGKYAIGALVIDDRSPSDARAPGDAAWFGAARVMRDVGAESYVGAFISDRSSGPYENTVGAIDGRVKLGANWFASAQGVVSSTSRSVGTGSAVQASLTGSGRRFNYDLTYADRSPAFRAVDGFIPRVDLRSIDQTYSYRVRPRTGSLQAWGPDLVVNGTWDYSGRPLDRSVSPRFGWQWPGTTTLLVWHTMARQTLRPEEVPTVPTRIDTAADRSGIDFASALLPRIVGTATFVVGDGINLTPAANDIAPPGRVTDATVAATLRVTRSLMLDVSYLFDRLRDAASDRVVYTERIARVRVNHQFTRALAVRAIVQHNDVSTDATATALRATKQINYDLLLTFLTSPGTALYLGVNYDLANLDPSLVPTPSGLLRSNRLHNDGWQVFAKWSHLIRW